MGIMVPGTRQASLFISSSKENQDMTKKQGLQSVLFVAVLGMVLCAVFSVFDLPTADDTLGVKRRFNDFYDEPENTWDCVLIGTSCVDREWAAPLAWNDYGMAVYAMNTDAQPIALTTNLLDEVRKTQDVKLAVIDIRGIRMESLRPTEVRLRRLTDSMKFSVNRLKTVKKAIEFYNRYFSYEGVENGEEMLAKMDEASMYIPFLKYHSRWKTGVYAADFLDPANEMKGVFDVSNVVFKPKKIKPTKVITDTVPLNGMQTDVLDEILEYGEETGLEMLFISSPSNLKVDEQYEINAAIQYLEEKGAKVINYNTDEKYAEIGVDFSEDFYNEHHMNSKGAVKFTKYFSKYLHDNYQFEDKRGNAEYREWDEAYSKYVEFYENGWK